MLGSLLKKELKQVQILWLPSTNIKFETIFQNLEYYYFDVESIFLGLCSPNLVITNNRFSQTDNIINKCNKYCCNLIVIDHEERSDMISFDKAISKIKKIPNVLQIAMNRKIYNSWNGIHDIIVENNQINPQDFKEIIQGFVSKPYIL